MTDTYDPARALCAAIVLQSVRDHDWRFMKSPTFDWLVEAAGISKSPDECRAIVERQQAEQWECPP